MYIPVSWDQGEHDASDGVNSPTGAAPNYRYMEVPEGTPLADIALAAYGHNSIGNREKIFRANTKLYGIINIPI